MVNSLRIAALGLLLFASATHAGVAASPVGEWLVKDKTAHIRIADCGGVLWGVISRVDKPGKDENNPDPLKRGRSVLGLPILLHMQARADSEWKGDIYNADNGKTYHGGIWLSSADRLHVEGCVLGGLLCGGEDWTRLTGKAAGESDTAPCHRLDAQENR